jgi:hypothetical protein
MIEQGFDPRTGTIQTHVETKEDAQERQIRIRRDGSDSSYRKKKKNKRRKRIEKGKKSTFVSIMDTQSNSQQ